jgi:formyl-CoA transferase
MTLEEGMRRLEANNVPCGVVLSPDELVRDAHAIATGLFEESEHAIAGRIRQTRPAAQFGETAAHVGFGAPGLGEHSDEILAELRARTNKR